MTVYMVKGVPANAHHVCAGTTAEGLQSRSRQFARALRTFTNFIAKQSCAHTYTHQITDMLPVREGVPCKRHFWQHKDIYSCRMEGRRCCKPHSSALYVNTL